MPGSIRNMKLVGVGSEIQLGKGGAVVKSLGDTVKVSSSNGTLAKVQAATPQGSDDVVTKGFLDQRLVQAYNSQGTAHQGVKVVALQATTDSSGNWSIAIPSLGQTTVFSVIASAISPSSQAIDMVHAHLRSSSTTSVSGTTTRGTAVVLGGPTCRAGPAGIVINVIVWMK